jgi:hypothetical protein
MRRAQVVVYEPDGRLADLLRERSQREGWWLREVRHAAAVLGALQPGASGVWVLKVGRDLERELSLLEKVSWLRPETATVVVGDVDNAPLADLAWDLGASLVHFPPLARAWLPEAIAGLLPVRADTDLAGGGPVTGGPGASR